VLVRRAGRDRVSPDAVPDAPLSGTAPAGATLGTDPDGPGKELRVDSAKLASLATVQASRRPG